MYTFTRANKVFVKARIYQQKISAFHRQVSFEWKFSLLPSAHYSKTVEERLNEKNVPFVICKDNPPTVPQACPIETIWTLIERKVYENNWEAKNLDLLARRIK